MTESKTHIIEVCVCVFVCLCVFVCVSLFFVCLCACLFILVGKNVVISLSVGKQDWYVCLNTREISCSCSRR